MGFVFNDVDAVLENIGLAKTREAAFCGPLSFAFYFYFIGFGLILCHLLSAASC
jgi:hypothetical protein